MNLTRLTKDIKSKHNHRIRFGGVVQSINQENGKGVVEISNLHIGKNKKDIVSDRVFILFSSAWETVNVGDSVLFDAKLIINSMVEDKKYHGKSRYEKELSRYVSNYRYKFYLTYVTGVASFKRIFCLSDL